MRHDMLKRMQMRDVSGVLLHSIESQNAFEPDLHLIHARFPQAFIVTLDIKPTKADCGWYEVATFYLGKRA